MSVDLARGIRDGVWGFDVRRFGSFHENIKREMSKGMSVVIWKVGGKNPRTRDRNRVLEGWVLVKLRLVSIWP